MIEFERWHVPEQSWDVWDLINRWHYYRAEGRSPELHERIMVALEPLLDANPGWVQGWLVKGFMSLEGLLFRIRVGEADGEPSVVRRNLDEAIERVRSLRPDSAQAAYLEALRERFVGQRYRFPALIERVLELNPHPSELRHHGGTLLALGGDWKRGWELVGEAGLHHGNPFAYRNFFVADALRLGDCARARSNSCGAAPIRWPTTWPNSGRRWRRRVSTAWKRPSSASNVPAAWRRRCAVTWKVRSTSG